MAGAKQGKERIAKLVVAPGCHGHLEPFGGDRLQQVGIGAGGVRSLLTLGR